jgi:flagellar assembly factor FliW
MKYQTARFGEIQVEEDKIITFPLGLPGFETFYRYILLQPDESLPISFMQSMDDSELAFLVVDPFLYYSDYAFDLSEDAQKELEIESDGDVMIWSIVTIKDQIAEATLNLKAPIILNQKKKIAKQIILHDSTYTTKHLLMLQPTAESGGE